MIEHVRIAVLDAYDHVIAYLDNSAPKALHYYDDELHEYLKGTAYTFSFCAGAKHEDSQYLVVGNKLSFVRGDKEYYLNIMSARQDEYKIEVEAYSLSFELLNEEKEAYKAEKAMSLKEYLSIFDFEKVLTLGNNEVSDKSIKQEWTGTDTLLARVFSLCNVFSAEAEFVIQLNDNYSLNKIVLNVYQEHSDTVQGVGVKRTDIILRYGKNVTGITKAAEITGLYTAIRPTGKDGLTVADLDKKEYDADGNLEYYTSKGSRNILAPQARDRFPSNLMSGENDRYIAKIWSYETDNVNMLYGQALAELKKNCVPQVKYEVQGFFDTNIGDTVSIEDDQYIPTLYLEARVTEQVRSFTDRTRNKTTFDNFKEVQAQLDPQLIAKMNALIEQNKTYTCMISTDNGTSFKNNEGSTILTASVWDGVNDVTDNFSIVWKKGGVDLSTGKSITVNAGDVDGKVLYRFEALDANGNVKGFYEVTITDVNDGTDGVSPTVVINEDTSLTITDVDGEKTTDPLKGKDGTSSYPHIKYSDDGETFTVDIAENLASQNRGDWMTGYYGPDSTISDAAPNKGTSEYRRICMAPVAVNPGDKYFLSPGCSGINMGYTRFDVDGNYVSWSMGSQKDTEYTVPEDTYYISVLLYDLLGKTVTSLGDWDVLFESGGIKPRFGKLSASLGDVPGAWMGAMTSDNPEPSLKFSDYTWKKIEGDPGKDGAPTGITESAEEPAEKYVGMLWKNTGTTSGYIYGATYRWNGDTWDTYKFAAENIDVENLFAQTVEATGTITAENFRFRDRIFGIRKIDGEDMLFTLLLFINAISGGNLLEINPDYNFADVKFYYKDGEGNQKSFSLRSDIEELNNDIVNLKETGWHRLIREGFPGGSGSKTWELNWDEHKPKMFMLALGSCPASNATEKDYNRRLCTTIITRENALDTMGVDKSNGTHQVYYNGTISGGISFISESQIKVYYFGEALIELMAWY